MRHLEIRGGKVTSGDTTTLTLPALTGGYADAQLDDYSGRKRRVYPHTPGITLSLSACFSHPAGMLRGTAGFGFWNAPFGDPTVPWPALPQAAWFFYASAPSDLPLNPAGPGQGWFAATLDATTWTAWAMAPLALPVILLNQVPAISAFLWPWVQKKLKIDYQQLTMPMTDWHHYQLEWGEAGCRFGVDEEIILQTNYSPQGPLGFVCWLDNQYMVVTARGRARWGTLSTSEPQWLALRHLQIRRQA
ncbi:MAG: hypothetical protein KA314_03825 [Chloroflexi bacterium]|nr:hypothetical protein [Chloroflexota bacterium]